ncbi:MAG: MATE family efflux transporter [Gemmatimonadetes bacterium]|nr:MATE family efflux transporter [Gemmatimonadota bacterium]
MNDRTDSPPRPSESGEAAATAAAATETAAPPVAAGAAPGAARKGRRFDRSIVEGPLTPAVWKLAWPTMLQNVIGGLQGMVDHAMVGHYVGYTGNAAIGVSWQIFLVVVVFISSLFTGMSILVARFTGADDHEKVNRTVYQAFLTAVGLSLGILAPLGYVLAPGLLDVINAAPEVQAEALPYLRIMFVFSTGMLLFFMLGGALRSAGDARTPLRLGIFVTVLNITLNVILIRGLGPIPAFGTMGAAMGTVIATGGVGLYALARLWGGRWVVGFPRHDLRPDWDIIRSLFRFGLPTGIQGIAMNVGGVLLLGFVGSLALSAEAQAAYAITYTQLFSFITWTSVGLMGAAAAVAGQNLGAGNADRATSAVHTAARIAVAGAATIGVLFLLIPRQLLGIFGMEEPIVVELAVQFMRFLSVSGLFMAVALTYTGGLQGTGDTKSPLYISIVSQIVVPLGLCFVIQQTSTLDPWEIWLAILLGHITRCTLSVLRFRQGAWREIVVDIRSTAR